MNEITLRLPSETTAALQSEADERGVTVEEHLRDIVDAYCADDRKQVGNAVEYAHAVAHNGQITQFSEEPSRSEEIGSFRYGSRSILSK